MAKKRSRKSKRRRQHQPSRSASAPAPAAPTAEALAKETSRPAARLESATQDFVQTYAYVYFDLRKMFTLAALVFALLILTNVLLRYFLVL